MILVSGASGNLSSLIVTKAKSLGLEVVTASRATGADRQIDFDDVQTLNFSGVTTLFLTSAGYAEDDVVMYRHGNVIRAAVEQGVTHIVYSSFSVGSDHLGFALAHRWTERRLQQSGLSWTILRNGLYAELVGNLCRPLDGRITTPLGNEGIAAVAREDLAEAAIAVLADVDRHRNKVYELSGVKPFSARELAERIGATYEPTTLSIARARLAAMELLPFQAPMLMSIYSSAMAGFLKTDTTDLTTLLPGTRDALAIACATATQ